MLPRRAAALLLAGAFAACGEAEPRWKERTAAEWTERLWGPTADDVAEAHAALVALADRRPDAVLAAMEAAMRRPAPRPAGSPFSVAVDLAAARRLGLPEVPPSEAIVNVLPVVRARLAALGLVPTTSRSDPEGRIDLVAPDGRPRAEIEHAQALLATRGGLDVRAVVRPPGSGGGGRVYDGARPWPELLAAETRLLEAARASGAPYRPGDPRWRLVLADPAAGPVLLEEPREASDAIDERLARSAEGLLAKDGSPVVRIGVRAERKEDVARFLRRNAGGEMAVLVDGELRARQPVPAGDGTTLVVSPGPAPKGRDPLAWAKDHALLFATGRMPWPLQALPLPDEAQAGPPPENPFSKVAVAIGARAAPMLRRLAADAPAWSRASAAWALERIDVE